MGTVLTVEVKDPAGPVIQAASLLAPGRALDIACGAGRHAIWLQQHGWKVTAVDRDQEAIEQIQRNYPAIDARVMDLECSPFVVIPDAYDLVVCWLYFQRDLYPLIREGLRPGGIAALSARLHGRFATTPHELRSYFPGWKVLHQAQNAHSTELVAMSDRL